MDYVGLHKCLVEAGKTCFTGLSPDMPEIITILPALRTPTMGQSAGFAKKLCTAGCMKENLMYERVTAMKKCWKDNEAAVEAMLKQNSGTPPQCGPVGAYMQCQWQQAEGCDFLEALIRLHLQSLEDVITECKVTLPAAATQEPRDTGAMVGTASGVTSPCLAWLMVVAVFSVFKTMMDRNIV